MRTYTQPDLMHTSTHLAIVEDLIHVVVQVLRGVPLGVHQVAVLLQVGDMHKVTLQHRHDSHTHSKT